MIVRHVLTVVGATGRRQIHSVDGTVIPRTSSRWSSGQYRLMSPKAPGEK